MFWKLKIHLLLTIKNQFVGHRKHSMIKICALLGYYAAWSGSSVPTFRDNLSVPSWRFKRSNKAFFSWTSWPLKTRPIGCPETSVQKYHSTPRNIPEEHRYHVHHGGSLESRSMLRFDKPNCECTKEEQQWFIARIIQKTDSMKQSPSWETDSFSASQTLHVFLLYTTDSRRQHTSFM
jgi:hypothetical protein